MEFYIPYADMLSTALKFQVAYPPYKERELHYNYAPSDEDWEKVKKICPFLEPTDVCEENIEKVKTSLQMLYDEYVEMAKEEAGTDVSGEGDGGCNPSSSHGSNSSEIIGFDQIMSIVHKNEAVPPTKSELQTYLEEGVHIPDGGTSTLEWWKNNSLKYKILSKMAADILAIPISTVASESTFSVGRRVIDDYRSKLNEDSIEALICGGDWLRNKYGLKKTKEIDQEQEMA